MTTAVADSGPTAPPFSRLIAWTLVGLVMLTAIQLAVLEFYHG